MANEWFIFGNSDKNKRDLNRRPAPPPWRDFDNPSRRRAYEFELSEKEVALVNAALYLRRPLLITGQPGTGKSSLAYAVAKQLNLGDVLVWPISSRSVLKDALYQYDAIGRLQAANLTRHQTEVVASPPIGDFLSLGPLGTAFADSYDQPRVLLIDEIDKSDIDLPNDLLYIFEEGEFEISELVRMTKKESTVAVRTHNSKATVDIMKGRVRCHQFPFVVLTSNGERELPAAFMRRCLSLNITVPNVDKLERIVHAHFHEHLATDAPEWEKIRRMIALLVKRRNEQNEYVATDQLLNAIYLTLSSINLEERISQDDASQLADYVLNTISRLRL